MKGFSNFYRYLKLRDIEHTLYNLAQVEFSEAVNAELQQKLFDACNIIDDVVCDYTNLNHCDEIFKSE